MIRARLLACALALAALVAFPAAAHASFGFVPGSISVTAQNADGTIDSQAGSHPYAFTLQFKLQTEGSGQTEGGAMRDLITDLPPGIFANPQAVPVCPRENFEGSLPNCSPATQVGVARVILAGSGEVVAPIYNLTAPPGVALELGLSAAELVGLFAGSVRGEAGYAGRVAALNLPAEVTAATATIWGNPADPSHDSERGQAAAEGSGPPVSSHATLLPFFTLPTACGAPPTVTLSADSKLAPGAFVSETAPMRGEGVAEQALTGCEAVPFSPGVLAAPTATSAESAAGLDFQLRLPNEGLLNPKEGAVSETEPESMEVALPAGITANPAAAAGLSACSPAQIGLITAVGQNPPRFNEAPASCPESSKVGTLVAQTPLLDEAIEGSVYLAAPHNNPFNSLLALYVVARAPQRGVLIKQAGRVDIDQATGRLTTTIDGLPPLPYSSIDLRLREGARGLLITPQVCGTYTTTAKLYPFSDPAKALEKTASFTISSGAGGGACAHSEAQLPNNPTLVAGSTIPIAGAYAPFALKLSREDGSQHFSSVEADLPPGLVGKLAGTPYCSDAAIAAAAARTGEGEGALELAQPSCPPASQVGTVSAGAGAGPTPYYAPGKAYLAGPYKGAPLSMVIITPAIAGPFDLGNVVVRAGIYVNESSAQIIVKSDPLPQILHGLTLDIRSVAVQINKSNFTLNPTSCEVKAITARETSTTGAVANLNNRFQVGACAALGFKPSLSLALKGGTKRNQHPALKSVITYPKGSYANIAKATVTLPASEFIDQAHIGSPCTRPVFAEEKCPKISILGKAKAWTPLLEKPEEGNVYFRSNGGERELPDIVVALKGQVPLTLVGFVDAQHHKGSEVSRLRTTFATAPDAPVSKFVLELKGGKEGLLVNSGNLCKIPNKAIVKLSAQNGRVYNTEPAVANGCGAKKAKKSAKRLGYSHR